MTSLAQAHRLAQQRVGIATVAHMLKLWPLLDPNDLNGSFDRWVSAVTPLVQRQRSQSSRLAANYYSLDRQMRVGSPFVPVLAETAPDEQIATSMLVTGPVSMRSNLGRGMLLAKAADIAMARSAGAAMRHALNGGRETITRTIQADHRARGYERVTSGAACDFCEMLADRGEVYDEESADFEAHDHCSCSAEPVFA